MQDKFYIKRTEDAKDLPLPSYMTDGAAGMDIYANIISPITISRGEIKKIGTGIKISIPSTFEVQIRPRSGLALRGITLVNAPGTVDSDFRGEIQVIITNLSNEDFVIERGMRIAQMVMNKIEKANFFEVECLDETTRGSGGFGHTGVR